MLGRSGEVPPHDRVPGGAALHQHCAAGSRVRQVQRGPGHPVPDGQQVAFADFHKRVLEFLIS